MSFVGFHSNTDGRVCRFSLKYTYIPFVGDCEKSLLVKRVNPYPFSGLQGADILAPLDTPPYPIAHAHK